MTALSAPCWWVDRGDCWETTHHPTREDAEQVHADQVRADHGWPLSVAGAFDVVPGVVQVEPRRCHEVTCPECGETTHVQTRIGLCGWCECEIETVEIAPDDPNQVALFEGVDL